MPRVRVEGHPPVSGRRKKRRRKVPRSIVTKSDREIAETVLGKRVVREVDRVLGADSRSGGKSGVTQ